MPEPIVRALAAFLNRHQIRGERLVIGVSGGADSLALLHGLVALRGPFELSLHVAHLNHQLRGAESEADARFVELLAQEWAVPATIESHDVTAFADARKLSVEEAARLVRYGFLAQVAEREGARDVAVAHHADDQVETILMHFLRGAGLAGLRGMLAVSHYPVHAPLRLLRPLLDVTREQIEAYCAASGLSPRVDVSNADTTLMRNRVRHELIPALMSYNPGLPEALRRNARVMADDYAYLHQRAQGSWQRTLLQDTGEAVSFAIGGWRQLQPSLKRMLIRQGVARLRPALRHLDAQPVEDALRVADGGRVGARASLPGGLFLFCNYDAIVIADKLEQPPLPRAPRQPIAISVPGETELGHGWRLEAKVFSREHLPADALQGIDPLESFFDADRMTAPLILRARHSDDVFRPLGLAGHSKPLRRFMIDAKIPAHWRARTPLVVADHEVLWVAGWRIADTVKVEAGTRRVLSLRFVESP